VVSVQLLVKRIRTYLPYNIYEKIDSEFTKNYAGDSNALISESYFDNGLRININHIRKFVHIDFSAKILGRDYPDNINIFNFRDTYKEINNIIAINPRMLYSAQPYSCENVNDIEEDNISETIDALFHISKLQDKYKQCPRPYKKQNDNTSIYLKKNVNTREISNYISIYNKLNELLDTKDKGNVKYMESLSEEDKNYVIEKFSGMLRIESKFYSKRMVRDIYGLQKDYNLYKLLTSSVNVNQVMLKKVYNEKLFECGTVPNLTRSEFDKWNTLKVFNYDLEKICEMLSLMGITRDKSKVKKLYKEIQTKVAKKHESNKIILIKNLINRMSW